MVTRYGAAGNDVSLFEGGALDALETLAGGSKQAQQAMALTRALTPERQEFDPAIAALRYFTRMASWQQLLSHLKQQSVDLQLNLIHCKKTLKVLVKKVKLLL